MAKPKQNKQTWTFQGVNSPNTTQVPDQYLDELLPVLTGAELKVLLYITRRTFGFKKESDNISLSQMLNGIHTKDGRVLDRGVGLTKKTLLRAIKGLVDKNIILTERRQSAEKGNEPTAYRLNIITPPLGEKVHQGVGGKNTPSPRGKNYTTQQTVKQQTVKQQHPLTPSQSPSTDGPISPITSEDVVVFASLLKDRGVHPKRAATLARNYPAARIQDKVDLFDYLTRLKSPLIAKNPAGWLCKAIEEDYYPPKHYLENKHRELQRQQQEEEQRRTKAQELQRRAKELAQDPKRRAEAWLAVWEQGRATLGKPPLTADERQERVAALAARFTQEREEFFAAHPELAPPEARRERGLAYAPTTRKRGGDGVQPALQNPS